MDNIIIGIITTSDRASKGIYEDISGLEIKKVLNGFILNKLKYNYRCISDDQSLIEENLIDLSDNLHCNLIVTTGGTGPSLRDVTVEATEKVCQKLLPGFGEQMRQISLKYVPTAILSRQTAGIYNSSLIVNLPGKPKSIKECLEAIFPAIPYCIDLINGPFIEADSSIIKIFRPL